MVDFSINMLRFFAELLTPLSAEEFRLLSNGSSEIDLAFLKTCTSFVNECGDAETFVLDVILSSYFDKLF